MEQTELEADVYAALTSDTATTSALANGANGIYHIVAPAGKSVRYPHIVYSVSSDVPAMHGDNTEMYHDVSIRLHIVTKDGEYEQLNKDTKRVMLGLGFMRRTTTPYDEYDLKVLVCDYIKTIQA